MNTHTLNDVAHISDETLIDKLHKQLNLLNSHGLADLNNASLMNRVDSKFIMPLSYLPKLLEHAQDHYSVLEINGKRISKYHNQYFDTKSMNFYQDHHNGKLNRFKVRERRYVDTNTKFLEVKFKNNKKRTIKSRVELNGETENTDFEPNYSDEKQLKQALINEHLGKRFDDLMLVQRGGYRRIALANEAQGERLTIDYDLWFEQPNSNDKLALKGFLIAELKQNKKSKQSPFYQLMSANNIFPVSFSKYCIGCALLLGDTIKVNRFKPTISKLSRFTPALAITPSL